MPTPTTSPVMDNIKENRSPTEPLHLLMSPSVSSASSYLDGAKKACQGEAEYSTFTVHSSLDARYSSLFTFLPRVNCSFACTVTICLLTMWCSAITLFPYRAIQGCYSFRAGKNFDFATATFFYIII